MRKKFFLSATLVLCFLGWTLEGSSQHYPTRPITLLIGVQPGGSIDTCGRMIAENAAKILDQEIIPVNRGGGGGAVAIGILAHSKADGYTLMIGVSPALTIVPHLETVPYDPLEDVVPVIQYGVPRSALLVRSDSPFNSVRDVIDYARKNPGKVSCANPGFGGQPHLAMEYLALEENVNIPKYHIRGLHP